MKEKITSLMLLGLLCSCEPNPSEILPDNTDSLINAEQIEADRKEYQTMIELSQTLQKYSKVDVALTMAFAEAAPITLSWNNIDTIKTHQIIPISFLSLGVPAELSEADKNRITQAIMEIEKIVALKSVANPTLTEFELTLKVKLLPEEARDLEMIFEFDGNLLDLKYLNNAVYDKPSSIAKNWVNKRIDYRALVEQSLKR